MSEDVVSGDLKVCVIAGVGMAVGASCARRYSENGYRVYMLARDGERLSLLENEINNSRGIAVDLSVRDEIYRAVDQILSEVGQIDVLVYNAARGTFGHFLEVDPCDLEENFAVNTMGLLHMGQAVAPHMIKQGSGAIMVTGNTSALRGKERFSVFAPTKAAQRILAESMARHLGPQGIHVSYILVDAAIDTPRARKRFPEKTDPEFCSPPGIADTIFWVSQQPEGAWTFNVDLRPYLENW